MKYLSRLRDKIKLITQIILTVLLFTAHLVSAANLPNGAHPRIWLTPTRISELQTNVAANTADWQRLYAWCEKYYNTPGYATDSSTWQGGYRYSVHAKFILNFALAYHALKATNPERADQYAAYAIAVMDGLITNCSRGEEINGLSAIRVWETGDSSINTFEIAALGLPTTQLASHGYKNGYSARTIGVAFPLAYDWLYNKLSAQQKATYASVMYRWVDWAKGTRSIYNNGVLKNGIRYYEDADLPGDAANINPTGVVKGQDVTTHNGYRSVSDNFYSGYLEMAALASIAAFGETDDGQKYLDNFLLNEWANNVKPALLNPLLYKGGETHEGWGYGSNWFRILESLYAFYTSTGDNYFTDFPWPQEYMRAAIHTVTPTLSKVSLHGDWSGSLEGVPYRYNFASPAYILSKTVPVDSIYKVGNYVLNNATFRLFGDEWERFIWSDPNAEAVNISAEPLYYHAVGEGRVSTRSSWNNSPDSVYFTIRLGALTKSLSHQARDNGDFQVNRGSDILIGKHTMDAAARGHSTIVFNSTPPTSGVDDQFVQPRSVIAAKQAIDRIENTDDYLYVSGDITNALKRAGYPDRGKLFRRSLLYVRPNFFVMYDQTQSNLSISNLKTWFSHYRAAPTIASNIITVSNGNSRAFVETLYPTGGSYTTVANTATGYWDVGYTPAFNQEYEQFLHVTEATSLTASKTSSERIKSFEGKMIGAYIKDTIKPTVVLFSADKDGKDISLASGEIVSYTITSPSANLQQVLVHLSPNSYLTLLPETSATGLITYRFKSGMFPAEGTVYKASPQGVISFLAGAPPAASTPPVPPTGAVEDK